MISIHDLSIDQWRGMFRAEKEEWHIETEEVDAFHDLMDMGLAEWGGWDEYDYWPQLTPDGELMMLMLRQIAARGPHLLMSDDGVVHESVEEGEQLWHAIQMVREEDEG